MSIRKQLIFSLTILCGIIIAVGLIGMSSLNSLVAQKQIFDTLSDANTCMYKARLAQADFILTGDSVHYDKAKAELSKVMNSFAFAQSKMEIAENISKVDDIKKLAENYTVAFETLATQMRNEQDITRETSQALINTAN